MLRQVLILLWEKSPKCLSGKKQFETMFIEVVCFVNKARCFVTDVVFSIFQFNMNAVMVGVVFLVNSIFYAGLSPLWGYLADKW